MNAPRRPDRYIWVAVSGLILLAFALRLYRLEIPSLWSDEGLSLYRARQSWAEIGRNIIVVDGFPSVDNNPPLYFYLLHLWRARLGESVFALRLLGAMLGVLAIPLFYQLGRVLLGRSGGLLAAGLLTISPFHIWQSQELRNYPLLLALNILAIYALARWQQRPAGGQRWLGVWLAAALAGVYTHYFGFFILALGVLVVVGQRLAQRSAWRPNLWLAAAAAALLFALWPIVPTALTRLAAGRQIDFVYVPLGHLLSHAASVYSVGITPGVVQPWLRVAPALLLAGWGLVSAWRGQPRPERFLLLGYLALPLGLLAALSLVNPLYNGPRHLLMGLPPFLLWLAAGVCRAPRSARWGGWILLASVALIQVDWLHTQFTDPALVKDDIQGAAAYLNAVAEADDVIILHDTLIRFTFDYYYDGAAPVTALPRWNQFEPADVAADLQAATAGARRVWFLTEPAPRTGFDRTWLRDWANAHWPKLLEQRFAALWLSVRLEAFTPQPVVAAPPPAAQREPVVFDGTLELVGLSGPPAVTAGAWQQLAWYWRKLTPTAENYVLSMRWLDETGQAWAQVDTPLWATWPPAAWEPQTIVEYAPPWQLPAGVPPGPYQVMVRLVRQRDGQPALLPNGQADLILWEHIQVTAAAQATSAEADLPSHTPLGVRLGGQVELVGATLPPGQYRPGHSAAVDVYWRVLRPSQVDYDLQLHLRDAAGRIIAESVGPATRATYPATQWQTGDWLRGQGTLVAPAQTQGGHYDVRAALVERPTQRRVGRWVTLGALEIVPWPLETTFGPIAYPGFATLGMPTQIEWHGSSWQPDPPQAGASLEVTLFWRAVTLLPESYTIFVHLTDSAGAVVAQGDSAPVYGLRPTPGWRPGEAITDPHTLLLPAELPAGAYTLWAGFYHPVTFVRLPVFMQGAPQPDDRLPVGVIHLGSGTTP